MSGRQEVVGSIPIGSTERTITMELSRKIADWIFEEEFLDKEDESWGKMMYDDVVVALDKIIDRHIISQVT